MLKSANDTMTQLRVNESEQDVEGYARPHVSIVEYVLKRIRGTWVSSYDIETKAIWSQSELSKEQGVKNTHVRTNVTVLSSFFNYNGINNQKWLTLSRKVKREYLLRVLRNTPLMRYCPLSILQIWHPVTFFTLLNSTQVDSEGNVFEQ